MTLPFYFYFHIIAIKGISLIIAIITIYLANDLLDANYLRFQPLIIALKCLTCLYSIHVSLYSILGWSISQFKIIQIWWRIITCMNYKTIFISAIFITRLHNSTLECAMNKCKITIKNRLEDIIKIMCNKQPFAGLDFVSKKT